MPPVAEITEPPSPTHKCPFCKSEMVPERQRRSVTTTAGQRAIDKLFCSRCKRGMGEEPAPGVHKGSFST